MKCQLACNRAPDGVLVHRRRGKELHACLTCAQLVVSGHMIAPDGPDRIVMPVGAPLTQTAWALARPVDGGVSVLRAVAEPVLAIGPEEGGGGTKRKTRSQPRGPKERTGQVGWDDLPLETRMLILTHVDGATLQDMILADPDGIGMQLKDERNVADLLKDAVDRAPAEGPFRVRAVATLTWRTAQKRFQFHGLEFDAPTIVENGWLNETYQRALLGLLDGSTDAQKRLLYAILMQPWVESAYIPLDTLKRYRSTLAIRIFFAGGRQGYRYAVPTGLGGLAPDPVMDATIITEMLRGRPGGILAAEDIENVAAYGEQTLNFSIYQKMTDKIIDELNQRKLKLPAGFFRRVVGPYDQMVSTYARRHGWVPRARTRAWTNENNVMGFLYFLGRMRPA